MSCHHCRDQCPGDCKRAIHGSRLVKRKSPFRPARRERSPSAIRPWGPAATTPPPPCGPAKMPTACRWSTPRRQVPRATRPDCAETRLFRPAQRRRAIPHGDAHSDQLRRQRHLFHSRRGRADLPHREAGPSVPLPGQRRTAGVVHPTGPGFSIAIPPYSFQQRQDNREWHWSIYDWWFATPLPEGNRNPEFTVKLDRVVAGQADQSSIVSANG